MYIVVNVYLVYLFFAVCPFQLCEVDLDWTRIVEMLHLKREDLDIVDVVHNVQGDFSVVGSSHNSPNIDL